MFCGECGSQLKETATTCSCGAIVQQPVLAAESATAAPYTPAVQHSGPAEPITKPCPFCGEQILQEAIRCKHCRADLSSPTAAAPQNSGDSVVVRGPQLPANQPTIVIQNVQNHQVPQVAAVQREIKNPGLALLFSFVFPGGGQFYNGEAGKGILVLLTFWLFGITYLWSLFDAYNSAKRINRVGF
jgi:TM2 domain-containing membrane protein YozV